MSLYVFVGSQASGKSCSNITESTKWLDVLGGRGLFINSSIDERDMINVVSSNSSSYRGISDSFDKVKVLHLFDVLDRVDINTYQVISIDEIQFYDDLESFVTYLLNLGKHIVCSGLDSDWLGNDFGQVKELLKLSTNFIKLHAKCLWCKEKSGATDLRLISDACRTGKLISNNKKTECGGKELYVPLCLNHHREHLVEIHKLNPNDKNTLIPSPTIK